MGRFPLALLLLVAVVRSAPASADEIAHFRLIADSAADSAQVVTFGQVFLDGAIRPGQAIGARLDGVPTPVQMDAKALYPDGSVRHAVLSLTAPPMSRGEALAGAIAKLSEVGPSPMAWTPPTPPSLAVDLTPRTGPAAGRPIHIELSRLVSVTSSDPRRIWLKGPLVAEQRYTVTPIPGLQIAFDVRTTKAGAVRVDVIFRNDRAQDPAIATLRYEVSLRLGDQPAFVHRTIVQPAYTTWHEAFALAGPEPPRVVPDIGLLKATGAIPYYDELQPSPAAVAELVRQARRGPAVLGAAGVTPYMPTTGGRADIGPLPTWAVFDLLAPSQATRTALLRNADAAGAVPWHVRDGRTDDALDIGQAPQVWLDERGAPAPPLATAYHPADAVLQPDDAHQPSLTYLPYLLTGSRYYRDELAMQAAYVLLAMNPHYRGGSAGLLLGSQVRAIAWDLRTLANAAYALPADHPLQPVFRAKLEANLRQIRTRYVEHREFAAARELEGYLPGPYAVAEGVPPWQDDYLMIVLGWVDAMGFADARPIMSWMSNFVAGRFTSAERGYDPLYGTAYVLIVGDPATHRSLGSWDAVFKASFDPKAPVAALDSAESGGGYAAVARGALASLVNAGGSPRARAAYAFVEAHTRHMDHASDPTFAIALRRPEGGGKRAKSLGPEAATP